MPPVPDFPFTTPIFMLLEIILIIVLILA